MQYLWLVCLLLVYARAQESTTVLPEWNGDPKICTVGPSEPTMGPPMPIFTTRAEFSVELVAINHVLDTTLPTELTMTQYIYDYDANKVIMVQNKNGLIDVEYFYYDILKKSTYFQRNFCVVTDIPNNNDMSGLSAIQLPNGIWHVRPLNEFLLFSSNDPRRPIIRPRYIGQNIVRGIPVEQWEACIIDKAEMSTFRRIWSFARSDVKMPIGVVKDMAVPVQAFFSASQVYPNGTQHVEVDQVLNILSYKPGILENANSLAPPKGVFCSNPNSTQNLVTLSDVGVSWPHRFSVRIDVSTSSSKIWQTFHLRIDQNRERKRIRYDYMPTGAEDFRTIILDYKDNLTYSIDRRYGSCEITTGTEYQDVSPIAKPIEFFIKHEKMFITNPAEKAWEHNGFRTCRGKTINCVILTTSVSHFPPIIDSDTDKPTGEFWEASNIEYGWSMRAPLATSSPDHPNQFDYPVHLYMKMYRYNNPNLPTPSNIRTEDIEYEFYEMSTDIHMTKFDTSICYRSLDLPYLHLGFVLKPSNGSLVDSNHLDRHDLEVHVGDALVNGLQVSETRVSNIELDHIRFDNSIYVLFTLLGPVPLPNNEPSVETARQHLQETIDAGAFTFNMTLLDQDRSQVAFRAQANSLKVSNQFMSIHASSVYANVSNCNASNANFSSTTPSTATPSGATPSTATPSGATPSTNIPSTTIPSGITPSTNIPATTTPSNNTPTNTIPSNTTPSNCNNSHINGPRIKQEKYTVAAQVGGIIGGLIVGIVLGLIVIVIVQRIHKEPRPALSSSTGGGLNNISFNKHKQLPSLSMKDLQENAGDAPHA